MLHEFLIELARLRRKIGDELIYFEKEKRIKNVYNHLNIISYPAGDKVHLQLGLETELKKPIVKQHDWYGIYFDIWTNHKLCGFECVIGCTTKFDFDQKYDMEKTYESVESLITDMEANYTSCFLEYRKILEKC